MKKTNVHFEPKFIVNEDKKTVTCVADVDLKIFYINELNSLYFSEIKGVNLPKETMFKAIGIAKCSKEDTFDVELGKRIAESKAKRTAFKQASNFYSKLAHQVRKTLFAIGCLEVNNRKASKTEEDHLNYLYNKLK